MYTAVGTAFVQFVTVEFYHALMKRDLGQLIQKWYVKFHSKRTAVKRDTDNECLNRQVIRQPTHSDIALHELREPLLTN